MRVSVIVFKAILGLLIYWILVLSAGAKAPSKREDWIFKKLIYRITISWILNIIVKLRVAVGTSCLNSQHDLYIPLPSFRSSVLWE